MWWNDTTFEMNIGNAFGKEGIKLCASFAVRNQKYVVLSLSRSQHGKMNVSAEFTFNFLFLLSRLYLVWAFTFVCVKCVLLVLDYLGNDWQLLQQKWEMTQTVKGLETAWPDLLIIALLFRAGRLESCTSFFQANKDGIENSSWAGLPIPLTPPLIFITVNGFFASARWTQGVVKSFAQEHSHQFMTLIRGICRECVRSQCIDSCYCSV